MENFRSNLSQLDWKSVQDSNNVDIAYGNFWDIFKTLFDINFPATRKKFNKNFHKINGYMTKGLLVSRATKLKLHKKSIAEPTEINLSAYRSFRNLYTKILRASKKLYFDANFKKAKNNPKKTWDLIREAIGSEPKNSKISKLTVAGKTVNNPT